SNHFPVIYVPSLMPKIKMTLGLQGELHERQKFLYQAAATSYQSKTHYNQSEELCPEMDTFIFVLDENLTDDDTVLAIAIRKHFCHF
ncbi:unnamed protein product, partial [Rotaria sordida]